MYLNYLRHLWYLLPDNGAGDGGDSGATTTGQNSGAQTPSEDTTKREIPANWKAMSAEDFNERLSKEQRAAMRKTLKDLGFTEADFDTPEKLEETLKAAGELVTFAREQRRAQLSAEEQVKADLDAAQQTASTEQTARQKAEQERDLAQAQLREYILRSTITAAAAGAVHPSDVYDLFARLHAKDKLDKVIKVDTPLFTDDGAFNLDAIDQNTVKDIIEACRTERREWWQNPQRGPGTPSHSGAQPPSQDPSKVDRMAERARQNIRGALR